MTLAAFKTQNLSKDLMLSALLCSSDRLECSPVTIAWMTRAAAVRACPHVIANIAQLLIIEQSLALLYTCDLPLTLSRRASPLLS